MLRSVADETRALLLRLLAYAGILAAVVLIGMELVSGGEVALGDFADYISKTKVYETSTNAEAALGDVSAGDRMPAAQVPPDRAAGLQAAPATMPAPPSRDHMRRQRLLEPAQSPPGAPCRMTKADRGRCHTAASDDWVTANEAPGLRGRI